MARGKYIYKMLLPLTVFISFIVTSCTVGYKNDGKEVTWHTWNEGSGHNSYKVDADPNTFEELDDDYGRDKKHAFYRGDIIKGADGSSFRVIGKWYAADNLHVYVDGELVENADPASFKVHSYRLTEDKND
uniref:DKNYY domain-containing protein n=1 Tax=Muribaculum intestinale TaxID=1796646 RepID=UPI00261B57A3